MGNSSIRIRHSYSGSGWSVRTIGPEKAEPKKESRRLRPFAWVLGGAIIVSILGGGGVAILSQRAPQPDRPESRPLSHGEFGLSSPGIQTEATGSIEEPIVVSPIPAPVAPVEPSAPAAPLVQVPQSEEAVHPLPAVPPISRTAESAGAQSNGTIERRGSTCSCHRWPGRPHRARIRIRERCVSRSHQFANCCRPW